MFGMGIKIILTIGDAKGLSVLGLLNHLLDLLHLRRFVTGNLNGNVDSLFDLGYLQDYHTGFVGVHLSLDLLLNN